MKMQLILIKKELPEIRELIKYLLKSISSSVTSMQASAVNILGLFLFLENEINLPTKNVEELEKLQNLLKENEKFVSTICFLMY